MAVNKSIRVVGVAPYRFLPARFGGHRGIAFFYRYFSRVVAFACVSVADNDNDVFAGYPQYRILGKSVLRYANFFNVSKVGKVVKKHVATHVMAEHPYMGWLVLLVRLFYKTKVVVHSHNIEAQRFRTMGKWWWRVMSWYEGIVYRKADIVFFITEQDRQYAIQKYRVKAEKSTVVTYGFQLPHAFSDEWKQNAKSLVRKDNNLSENTKILLFNGDFSYKPNASALTTLVEKILPRLQEKIDDFVLIVCGKSIPAEVVQQKHTHLVIKGFVDDIGVYFGGADVFLNPIVDGGGIKTKLVEALSYQTLAVSFDTGAIGVPEEVVDGKLAYVHDGDNAAFADAIVRQLDNHAEWHAEKFTEYFSWENIAKKAAHFLEHTP
ncbi:MAG: glycosyltransferase family 4 protein [Chitinophagaceae bacterium]